MRLAKACLYAVLCLAKCRALGYFALETRLPFVCME